MLRTEFPFIEVVLENTSCNLGDAPDPAHNCCGPNSASHKHMKYQEVFHELQKQIEAPSAPLRDTVKNVMQLVWRTCAPDAQASKTLTAAIERFNESFALLCFFAGMDAPERTIAEARKEARDHLDALCKVCTEEALETVH